MAALCMAFLGNQKSLLVFGSHRMFCMVLFYSLSCRNGDLWEFDVHLSLGTVAGELDKLGLQ